MKRSTVRLIGLAAAAALVFSGCSGGRDAQENGQGGAQSGEVQLDSDGWAVHTGEAKAGGTIRVLGQPEFSHLDPAMGNDGGVNNFYRLIYRQLTTYANETGAGGTEVVPDLATDTGTPNDDATEWTYTLKDGITFEDGKEILAEDVKFALERSMDPALRVGSDFHIQYLDGAQDYQGVYKDPDGLDSIEVVDEKTIIFHLNQSLANFPDVAAMQMFTPFPKGEVTTTDQIDKTPIASGPYKLDEYQPGSSLTLVRNNEWSADTDEVRPALPDGYEFLFGIDANTVDQRMIAGQGEDANAVNAYSIQAANLANIQTDELKARTVRDQPNCTTYMGMNMTKKPLDDLKVRQAINYAIDKQSVVTATGGPTLTQLASDMLLPTVPGWEEFDLYPTENSEGDVEKAKELLAEAGHGGGFDLVMDVRGLPKWQAQAEAVQDSLSKVGIKVELNVIDESTYYQVIGTPAQQNDIAITGWCSAWQAGEPLMAPLFHGDRIYDTGNYNLAQLDDPEINKRFDEISVMTDADAQNAEWLALDQEIMELAPVVPLVRDTPLQVVGANVGGAFSHAGQTGYVDLTSLGLKDPGA